MNDSSVVIPKKRFHSTRYEGLPRHRAVIEMGRYVKKYKYKRLNGNIQTFNYFNCQHDDLHSLATNTYDTTTLRMAFVGDIMWVGRVKKDYVDESVVEYLNSFDFVFGNLETPIDTTKRVPNLLPDYLTYNSPAALLRVFDSKEEGKNAFTALSLSNNHTLDRGAGGILSTIAILDSIGIGHTGVFPSGYEGKKYLTVNHKGFRIGIYAATYGLNFNKKKHLEKVVVNRIPGLAPLNPNELCTRDIENVLNEMRNDSVDIKIVSLHWGYEFELFPDPLKRELAQRIVGAGADIIVGSHPHVFQPHEVFLVNDYPFANEDGIDFSCLTRLNDGIGTSRKAIVFYSLGNFVSRMFTPACQVGAIASISFRREAGGATIDWDSLEYEFVYNKTPFFPGQSHRLVFYHRHREQLMLRLTKKNARKVNEVEVMIRHIGKR